MLTSSDRAVTAKAIHDAIMSLSYDGDQGIDGTKSILLQAGMLVETAFLFDNCEEALAGSFHQLADLLGCEPMGGALGHDVLPPATIVDFDTEHGRALARESFETWLDCPYAFHAMLLDVFHQFFIYWENEGQSRAESFRLLIEATHQAMSYELAAQELCDAVIEMKIGARGWGLADCISAMAGTAGRKLALSHQGRDQCCWFRGSDLPDILDQTAYVMTQEAVRLGLDCPADWRFGLPANDTMTNPPTALIHGLAPICRGFFKVVEIQDAEVQAVACAKAAGRMLAVFLGGARPELEPAIAKPLAMAALTESYKGVCVEFAAVL